MFNGVIVSKQYRLRSIDWLWRFVLEFFSCVITTRLSDQSMTDFDIKHSFDPKLGIHFIRTHACKWRSGKMTINIYL